MPPHSPTQGLPALHPVSRHHAQVPLPQGGTLNIGKLDVELLKDEGLSFILPLVT